MHGGIFDKSIYGNFYKAYVLCFNHFIEFNCLYMKSAFDLIARNAGSLITHFLKHQQAYCTAYLLSAVFLLLLPLGCAVYSSMLAYESMSYEAGSILLFRWFFVFLLVIFLLFSQTPLKKPQIITSKYKKKSRQPVILYWALLALFCFILLFPMLQFSYYGLSMVWSSSPFVVYLAGCDFIYLLFYCLIIRLYKRGYTYTRSDT